MACQKHDIVIVGGGVAGLATALALHRMGVKSVVLEQAEQLRTTGAALTLWPNAWTTLQSLGVADSIRHSYHQQDGMQGVSLTRGFKARMLPFKQAGGASAHRPSGDYSNETNKNIVSGLIKTLLGLEIRCIERSMLLETLEKALPEATIRYSSKLSSIQWNSITKTTHLKLTDGTQLSAKVLIGCDGVYSAVGRWLGVTPSKSAGRFAYRGMAKNPHHNHTLKLNIQVMEKGKRAGILPCGDDEFYWFITTKSSPKHADAAQSKDPQRIRATALETARDLNEEVAELIKLSPTETLSLVEIRTRWMWPWKWDEIHSSEEHSCVVLVGDAFHPMTPDLGQGACLALEDSVVLAICLKDCFLPTFDGTQVTQCLKKYRDIRKWRAFVVAAVALVAGVVMEGSSSCSRLLRDWVWLPLIGFSYQLLFVGYRCKPLPSTRN